MSKTITTLRDILTVLWKIQDAAWVREEEVWKHKRSNKALETYKSVSGKLHPIKFEEIEKLLTLSQTVGMNLSEYGKVLYLPPLERNANFVPILSLYCKLDEPQSIAKLRVMLVCLDDCFDGNQGVFGMGFRMETPESMNQGVNTTSNVGMHDFHHAQLIRTFGQKKLDNKLQIHCPIWLPQSQPSFPLPAKCPITMLLCMIVTLYGGRCYNRFVKDYNIFGLAQHTQKLDRWINYTSIQQASTQVPPCNR